MRIAGAALIAFGLFMLGNSGLGVLYAFRTQRLLTGSVVRYALLRALIPAEDRWLKEKSGAQYDEYPKRALVKVFYAREGSGSFSG